jgi:hypothetical protein
MLAVYDLVGLLIFLVFCIVLLLCLRSFCVSEYEILCVYILTTKPLQKIWFFHLYHKPVLILLCPFLLQISFILKHVYLIHCLCLMLLAYRGNSIYQFHSFGLNHELTIYRIGAITLPMWIVTLQYHNRGVKTLYSQ